MTEYLKLVSKTAQGLRSFSSPFGPLSLEYQIGERTTPEVGGVLVYRTLADVYAFVKRCGFFSAVVLRGIGEEIPLPEFRHSGFEFYEQYEAHVREVWAGRVTGAYQMGAVRGWPKGTVALAWFEPYEEEHWTMSEHQEDHWTPLLDSRINCRGGKV